MSDGPTKSEMYRKLIRGLQVKWGPQEGGTFLRLVKGNNDFCLSVAENGRTVVRSVELIFKYTFGAK